MHRRDEMEDQSNAVFRVKYDSLKATFEARLASLADNVRLAVESIHQDQVLLQLQSSTNTREFAPAHARALIKQYLVSERDAFFHGLAARLADAEAEVARCTRRNEELESSLSVFRGEVTKAERSRVEVTSVNADIQELRREYQIALEDASEECQQLKVELSRARRRSGVLKGERDQYAAQLRSLEQALADAGEKKLEALRLERELGEEKSTIARLSSELTHAQQSLDGLASSHEKLKAQTHSLQNDLNQRDRRLQLADVNRKKNEAQFREAVARMESLMEEEAKESAAAMKNLRDKAMLTKDRLLAEVERLQGANGQLAGNLSKTKAKCLELELHMQAALKAREIDASAATAREEALRAEAQQARARADTMSQSLAEAIREQSGLASEAANAKATADVLEAKNRMVEVEMARAAGRESERAQSYTKECTPTAVPSPGWEVDNLLAEKLQEASRHISELRMVLRQEVRKREAAEAEVSEAQGYLNSSRQELGELRHLAWKLEQMGRNSIAHIDQKNQAIKQLEDELYVRGVAGVDDQIKAAHRRPATGGLRTQQEASWHHNSDNVQDDPTSSRTRVETRRETEGEKQAKRYARRHALMQAFSNAKHLVAGFCGLRSELQCITAQLGKAKAENNEFMRRFAEGVAVRADRLARALQQAARIQGEAQRQALEAIAAGVKDKDTAEALARVVQGISAIVMEHLGVAMPSCLGCESAAAEKPEGATEKGLSELAAAIKSAVSRVAENAKQAAVAQRHPDSSRVTDGQHRKPKLDVMVWGERSKDDFNLLTQLQKIEAESELQSLQARLDDMTEKYSRAIAEQETVDSAPLQAERERAKEELASAVRVHSSAMSALETTLAAEQSRCQDIRMRMERQAREHQAALADAEQRLLRTQEDLDEALEKLEDVRLQMERETARRARLEKKYSELEDRGLVSPRSLTPQSVTPRLLSPRASRPEASWKASGEARVESGQAAHAPLRKSSSARMVLEEARAKLGQGSRSLTAAVRSGQGFPLG